MALGKKIVSLRAMQGISQSEFINLLKKELPENQHEKLQGAISNLERRDSNTSKYTPLIAKVLNISIENLLNPNQDESSLKEAIEAHKNNQKQSKNEQTCPLITWDLVSLACDLKTTYWQKQIEEWRFCPVPHHKKTFVLPVNSNSMLPAYHEGIEIFVDPTIEPQHNDDVIVSYANGATAFKRLKITNEGTYLETLNPDFPERIIKMPENTKICGVVIYAGWQVKRNVS